MCELVVYVHDKIGADIYETTSLPGRGDVIDVLPDDHSFGLGEISHISFRVLALPGVSVEDVANLLAPEVAEEQAADADAPNTLQFRMNHLNLDSDAVPADLRKFLDDDERKTKKFVVEPNLIGKLFARRPPVAAPTKE
jgi:hypothetical protein